MRIGIIGSGYIADFHARAVKTAGARLVAAANHRSESLTAFAERHGIERTFSTHEGLLQEGGVDGVIIATPNALHAKQSIDALRSGVDVLLEKPAALNAMEAESIAQVESATGYRVMLAHCLRFDDQVRWVRERVQSGDVGTPVHAYAYAVHERFAPTGWFTDPNLAGGGALMDIGVHAVDAARFVLGDPLPAAITAHIGTYFTDGDVDDTAILDIEWQNGASSTIEAGWLHPHAPGPVGTLRVTGNGGYAQTYPAMHVSSTGRTIEDRERFPAELTDEHLQTRYDRQLEYFVKVVAREVAPSPSIRDGVVCMQIVDAAYQSATARRTVTFE